jgi:hypothetical protein
MPRRSNEFQRLVYLIQRQVQDGKVTESAMLPERFGTGEREVDVYVETERGGVPIRISFECAAPGRKAGRPWVDLMVNKHSNLPTDKLVLVSKSGFSEPALQYAAKHRVEAVTFEAAEAVDWGAYIEQLRSLIFGLFAFSGKAKSMAFKKLRVDDPELVLDVIPEEYKHRAKGQSGSWANLISAILRNPDAAHAVMEWWFRSTERPAKFIKTLTVTFRDNDNRIVSRGIEYVMETLVLEVTVSVDSRPLDLSLSSFMGTGVGYGKVQGFAAGDAEVTVTATPGRAPVVSVSLGDVLRTGAMSARSTDSSRDN